MKARLLKQLLNNTNYYVHETDDKICIGSPMCHDLISFKKDEKRLRYALSIKRQNEHRTDLGNAELVFIWDTLTALIESGDIQAIIDGKDEIAKPIPVFYEKDGEIIETTTDKYGWPNVTAEGILMYNNVHFKKKVHALKRAVEEYNGYAKMLEERLAEIDNERKDVFNKLGEKRVKLYRFKELIKANKPHKQ